MTNGTMFRLMVLATGAVALATPALAQGHLAQDLAKPEDIAAITEALAGFGCELREGVPVEFEEAGIFEVDDAACGPKLNGQFDVKLGPSFNIISLTYDGPIDPPGAPVMAATPDEVATIAAVLAQLGCVISDEAGVEKETGILFELDDVDCSAKGQFDIKLNAEFVILSMTAD